MSVSESTPGSSFNLRTIDPKTRATRDKLIIELYNTEQTFLKILKDLKSVLEHDEAFLDDVVAGDKLGREYLYNLNKMIESSEAFSKQLVKTFSVEQDGIKGIQEIKEKIEKEDFDELSSLMKKHAEAVSNGGLVAEEFVRLDSEKKENFKNLEKLWEYAKSKPDSKLKNDLNFSSNNSTIFQRLPRYSMLYSAISKLLSDSESKDKFDTSLKNPIKDITDKFNIKLGAKPPIAPQPSVASGTRDAVANVVSRAKIIIKDAVERKPIETRKKELQQFIDRKYVGKDGKSPYILKMGNELKKKLDSNKCYIIDNKTGIILGSIVNRGKDVEVKVYKIGKGIEGRDYLRNILWRKSKDLCSALASHLSNQQYLVEVGAVRRKQDINVLKKHIKAHKLAKQQLAKDRMEVDKEVAVDLLQAGIRDVAYTEKAKKAQGNEMTISTDDPKIAYFQIKLCLQNGIIPKKILTAHKSSLDKKTETPIDKNTFFAQNAFDPLLITDKNPNIAIPQFLAAVESGLMVRIHDKELMKAMRSVIEQASKEDRKKAEQAGNISSASLPVFLPFIPTGSDFSRSQAAKEIFETVLKLGFLPVLPDSLKNSNLFQGEKIEIISSDFPDPYLTTQSILDAGGVPKIDVNNTKLEEKLKKAFSNNPYPVQIATEDPKQGLEQLRFLVKMGIVPELKRKNLFQASGDNLNPKDDPIVITDKVGKAAKDQLLELMKLGITNIEFNDVSKKAIKEFTKANERPEISIDDNLPHAVKSHLLKQIVDLGFRPKYSSQRLKFSETIDISKISFKNDKDLFSLYKSLSDIGVFVHVDDEQAKKIRKQNFSKVSRALLKFVIEPPRRENGHADVAKAVKMFQDLQKAGVYEPVLSLSVVEALKISPSTTMPTPTPTQNKELAKNEKIYETRQAEPKELHFEKHGLNQLAVGSIVLDPPTWENLKRAFENGLTLVLNAKDPKNTLGNVIDAVAEDFCKKVLPHLSDKERQFLNVKLPNFDTSLSGKQRDPIVASQVVVLDYLDKAVKQKAQEQSKSRFFSKQKKSYKVPTIQAISSKAPVVDRTLKPKLPGANK